jgi:hypothetical protein
MEQRGSPMSGYVYLLKANLKSNRTIYKIGMTEREPVDRYCEIKEEWWRKRRIKVLPVKSIRVREPNTVEAHFHRQFKEHRLYGKEMAALLGGGWCSGDSEWFAGSVERPALREFNRYLTPIGLPRIQKQPQQPDNGINPSIALLLLAAIAVLVFVLLF